jgi:hypothetical protein
VKATEARLVYAAIALGAFVLLGYDVEVLIGFGLGYLGRSVVYAAAIGAAIGIYLAYLAFTSGGILGILLGSLFGTLAVGAIALGIGYAVLSSGAGWYLGKRARGK